MRFHCSSYNNFGHENFGTVHIGVLQIEHLLPHCQGGDNTLDNLHLMCANCHSIKSKLELTFASKKLERADVNEEIPLIDPEDFHRITTGFQFHFILNLNKYYSKKRAEGYVLEKRKHMKNLIKKIYNNLEFGLQFEFQKKIWW